MRMSHITGLTLVELLIAIFVFSLVATSGYKGLQSVLDARTHLDQTTEQYQQLNRFFSRMESQLARAGHRPVRQANGRKQSAMVGYPEATDPYLQSAQILFTRSGGRDATENWITPKRIGYRLREESVELLRWSHLDQAPANKPQVDVLLEGVSGFKLRYLSASFVWENVWALNTPSAPLPKAIEVTLNMSNGDKIVRIFDLP